MAEHLVTGIAQSSDPEHLESALAKEPVVADRITIITKDVPEERHDESSLVYMYVGQDHPTTDVQHEVITGNDAILTNWGDPQVPNISADSRFVSFFTEPHVIHHLANFAIPQDQVQNYEEAIEAGRSVVLYKAAPPEAPAVEQTFKEAGLKNVKTFTTK